MEKVIREAVVDVGGRELSVAISFCPLSVEDPDCRLVRVIDLSTGQLLSAEEVLADADAAEVIRDLAERLVVQEATKLHIKEV